jgi:NAD(P)-dependent dehydrogenase (short-subunit alcohol dehydrogenase family)
MMIDEKTAIITGAGQGIGLKIARMLARKGTAIVLNDMDEALTHAAIKAIQEDGGRCIPMAGDCSDPRIIQAMVDAAVAHYGKVDIAIANAGITLFGDFLTYTPEAFRRVMDVNMAGTFFLAQAAARQMIRQGTGGSLLFTSSVVGIQAHKNLAAYAMTKAAINMLAKNLVVEVAAHGINVNTVAPGATLTERTLEDPDYVSTWSRLTPMGRPGTVSDVASAAVFLVSDEARHITGQCLVVDGGWTALSPNP